MDDKLSGNYNARRDNLTRFWRAQFGPTHAVIAIQSFFMRMSRDRKGRTSYRISIRSASA
jgi:hypothetical protein